MTLLVGNAGFEPIHDAHAIERVVFVVQFDSQFDDAVFGELKKIEEKFSELLPGRSEIQLASIKLGAKETVTQSGKSGGIIRRRVSPDGTVESELRIERSAISFQTTSYKGWSSFWTQARKYLDELLPSYLLGANVASVGLNYVDKFAWKGHPDNCAPKSLLKEDSKYLCRHIFETNEFWHSHTGVFINVDDFVKRLLNVDVNYLEELRPEGQERIISIITTLTDQFEQPDGRQNSVVDNGIEMIEKHMLEMHGFGKTVFSQLITEKMCKRIDLI